MKITDEAVEVALKIWFGVDYENGALSVVSGLIDVHHEMRAALEAALLHMGAARAPGRRYDEDHKNWEGWVDCHEPVRTCTCHPDDNPPTPCAEKYALGDCELSALTACRQEVERLREVLEPFALVAEHDIGEGESDDDIFWPISNARYSMAGRLRVGHLRRARAALRGQS